jgi:threonine dehydrogenase-like Zn-dependent dehydrogenase
MNEQQIIGSIIYRHDDFADALSILTTTGIDLPRHVTATIPLGEIVPGGFVPLIERRAEHVKIQVRPA